jgi:hypothetical protein
MYTAEISRANPSCFLFMIDRSGSMKDPFGADGGKSKAQGVADAINRLLQNLVIRCTKQEGVRYYYDVGVIGYGAKVGPAFAGALANQELVPIDKVADNPARIEVRKKDDGAGGVVDYRLPIYFDPVADSGTPMCAAFRCAHDILEKWVQSHPNSFPPIVINITDGEPTDGDPTGPADEVRKLATSDGNVLVFNCHISSRKGTPILFSDAGTDADLPDEHARLLYRMSSVLPSGLLDAVQSEGLKVGAQARGFVFQADMVEVIRFLDIGTRATTGLR